MARFYSIYAGEATGINYRYPNRFDADYNGAGGDHTDYRIAGRIAAADAGLNVYGYRGYPTAKNRPGPGQILRGETGKSRPLTPGATAA